MTQFLFFSQQQLTAIVGVGLHTLHDMGDGQRLEFPCCCVAETFAGCSADEDVWSMRHTCAKHADAIADACWPGEVRRAGRSKVAVG